MKRCWWRKNALPFSVLILCLILVGAGSVAAEGVPSPPDAILVTEQPEPPDKSVESFDSLGKEGESVDEFSDFDEFERSGGEEVFDPLAGYNRVMTTVNDRLYYWVLKPVARGYKFVLPEPVRVSIGRFFVNLAFPGRLVNNLLQLKLKRAGTETVRFVVNTTAGIAGFWDPASGWMDVPVYDEDFGQTLGHYGLGGGFHVVLPLFGPSNVRDTCGRIADWFLDPVHYLEDPEARAAVNAERMVNGASLRLGQYEAMTQDSLDLYILLRDSYESNRNNNIRE